MYGANIFCFQFTFDFKGSFAFACRMDLVEIAEGSMLRNSLRPFVFGGGHVLAEIMIVVKQILINVGGQSESAVRAREIAMQHLIVDDALVVEVNHQIHMVTGN